MTAWSQSLSDDLISLTFYDWILSVSGAGGIQALSERPTSFLSVQKIVPRYDL